MNKHSGKGTGFEGERQVLLPAAVIQAALRDKPLLHGLLAVMIRHRHEQARDTSDSA